MKYEIAPSVLSFDLSSLREPVLGLIGAGADRIHFDVMDGQFVPPITFGAAVVEGLRPLGDLPFEAHLMTLTPEAHFEPFEEAGCRRIYFHVEATAHAHRLCQKLHQMGMEAGVAINPATPAEAVMPLLGIADAVLVMTVNPGWGGQALIPECLDKAHAIRRAAPEVDIEVDGGIDPLTLPDAMRAGANHFVVGSYLAGHHTLAEGLKELRAACAGSY